jgi:hypothetical protein
VSKNEIVAPDLSAVRTIPDSLKDLLGHIPTDSVKDQNEIVSMAQSGNTLEDISRGANDFLARQTEKRMKVEEANTTVAVLPGAKGQDYIAFPITEPALSNETYEKMVKSIPEGLRFKKYSALAPEGAEANGRPLRRALLNMMTHLNSAEARLEVFRQKKKADDGSKASNNLAYATADLVELLTYGKTMARKNPSYWAGPEGAKFKEFLGAAASRHSMLMEAAAQANVPGGQAGELFAAYADAQESLLTGALGSPASADPSLATAATAGPEPEREKTAAN